MFPARFASTHTANIDLNNTGHTMDNSAPATMPSGVGMGATASAQRKKVTFFSLPRELRYNIYEMTNTHRVEVDDLRDCVFHFIVPQEPLRQIKEVKVEYDETCARQSQAVDGYTTLVMFNLPQQGAFDFYPAPKVCPSLAIGTTKLEIHLHTCDSSDDMDGDTSFGAESLKEDAELWQPGFRLADKVEDYMRSMKEVCLVPPHCSDVRVLLTFNFVSIFEMIMSLVDEHLTWRKSDDDSPKGTIDMATLQHSGASCSDNSTPHPIAFPRKARPP